MMIRLIGLLPYTSKRVYSYLASIFFFSLLYALNSSTMKNSSSLRFLLRGVCLFSILQGITGETSQCNTPKLGPKDKLALIFFENQDTIPPAFWENLCKAFKQFPKGLLSFDYKPGSLATGTVDNIKCGGGSCKKDRLFQCEDINTTHAHDCFSDSEEDFEKTLMCYCDGGANKLLLENSALRASLKIPETANPAMAANNNYDPCFKFGSYEEILNYFCQVYQKQVGNCG